MPKYSVYLTKTAIKNLDKLPDNIAESIIFVIKKLEENPRPPGYRKLKGRDGYRIRVGNYRVLYDIIDKTLIIEIITIGHRKNIYE